MLTEFLLKTFIYLSLTSLLIQAVAVSWYCHEDDDVILGLRVSMILFVIPLFISLWLTLTHWYFNLYLFS